MFLLVTRPPGRIQDGEISKRVVCLCLTKSHIKVEIRNMNERDNKNIFIFIFKRILS